MAVQSLLSKDLILITDNKQTCTEWLRNTRWLRVIRDKAHVKKREFIIIAYGIRVN